ncbi:MAG: CBS domain-containing protein [Pseudorhodoplanes sp.]
MIVSAILSDKGRQVFTISPTATLGNAVKTMAEKRIGALVVTGAGDRLTGIVSERDIVRMLAAHGAAALDMPLNEAMTRKVATCDEAETISSLMERMTAGKFRHMPVVESGVLVGMISIGDVVKFRLHEMEQEQSAMRDYIQSA